MQKTTPAQKKPAKASQNWILRTPHLASVLPNETRLSSKLEKPKASQNQKTTEMLKKTQT